MNKTIGIIIPAHNEITCIGATLDSLRLQTRKPDQVVVCDDYSSDGTGDFIRSHYPEVMVIRPDHNLGSKAKAQNFALFYQGPDGQYLIGTDMVVTIDADTSIASDGLEELSRPLRESDVKASCGTVIPANPNNPYTLGRLAEYLFAFAFPKQIQQMCGGKVYIVSGCFGCYDAIALRERGGWHTDTMAEDMDLTADFHQRRHKVAYVQSAVCYPVEPFNWKTYSAQMIRWSAAFFQNVKLHWKTYASRFFGIFVLVSFLDAFVGGIMYPLLPFMVFIIGWEKVALGFLLGDLVLVSIPILYMGFKLKIPRLALISIPFMYFLRYLNIYFWFRAMWTEWIIKKPLTVYVKGH